MPPCPASTGRRRRWVVAAGALLAGGTALAGCSSSAASGPSGPSGHGASASDASDSRVATVTITAAHGCVADHTSFPAGGLTFEITNQDATAVSEVELLDGERIVGEKENIPPGVPGRFAVTVDAGRYTLYCPGASVERMPLTVTGTAPTKNSGVAGLLATGAREYKSYVDTQVGYLVTAVRKLDRTLHGDNLTAARTAYMTARPFYEKIEPVSESFTNGKDNLDLDIDARANNVPAAKWEGFHRIEKGLFADARLRGLAGYGDRLVADVHELQIRTAALTYQAADLANGAQELLDEISGSKITGEEERYSHIDILDIANNLEGAQQAFADLLPALRKIDPALGARISAAFAALNKLVNTYRTTANPSGFVLYGALTDDDRQQLASAVQTVEEPLSQVTSKVANA